MSKNMSIQKILNYFILFILSISIIFTILLCGSPLNNNISIISITLNILAIFSIIVNTFMYHKKLTFHKYDIFLLCFSFLYLLPIVFQTYSSISDTFEYFLRYISVLCCYIILKNLDINHKVISIILHSIMIGVILIVFLGIDDMSTCFFEPIHQVLNTFRSSESSKIRLDSVFQYPNAFASLISFSCFLTFGLFLKTKNKHLRGIYAGCIHFQIVALMLSISRLNIAIFLLILLVYLVLLKDNSKIFDLLKLCCILFFTTLYYCSNYLDWITDQHYFLVWGVLWLDFFLLYILQIIPFKINKPNFSISIKKLIFISLFIILCIIVMLFILLQIPDSLSLFNNSTSEKNITIKQINAIQPNSYYSFEFNIEATGNAQILDDNYQIMIFELNESLENLQVHRIPFGQFTGIKSCSFTTSEDTRIIKIACKSKSCNESTRLTIYNCSMNQSNLLLNYKFLPTHFVFRLSQIFSGDNSLQERFIFIKDGITIGMQHFFTGSGANAWKYNFQEVQTVDYYTTEVHSYPIQIFIEVGIFGVLLLAVLFVNISIDSYRILRIKEKSAFALPFICALFSLWLHSCIDFDMSFFSILLLFYIVMLLLANNFSNITTWEIKSKKISYVINLFIIALLVYCLLLNIGTLLSQSISNQDSTISSLELSEKVLTFNPYNKNARLLKIVTQTNSQVINYNPKDFELFFKYEPKYPTIDYLKFSYIKHLLSQLKQDNLEDSISKINKISFSNSVQDQAYFRQEFMKVFELIKEKNYLYPSESFSSLYNKYSQFLK